jgi:hypothetical protein
LGSADDIAARLAAYHHAGADSVAVVPSTAEDPGGRAALGAVASAGTAGLSSPATPRLTSATADSGEADAQRAADYFNPLVD